jgi:diaminopimelate epimerase
MNLKFSKMHGLGNDFMVIDAISQNIDPSALDIKALADRRFGIGFDQLLFVEKSEQSDVDFRYRIFNADGNEVEQCGNGARCFARFVHDNKLTDKNPIQVETKGGLISLELVGNEEVIVDMGQPVLEASEIPVAASLDENNILELKIDGLEGSFQACAVSMGNPHAVIEIETFSDSAIEKIGKALQNHEAFPEQVNVGFMQTLSRNEIRLRVFERGVGETLACGTGACAAVVAGYLQGKLDSKVKVSLLGGDLEIEWQGENSHVFMEGSATLVFTGDTDI